MHYICSWLCEAPAMVDWLRIVPAEATEVGLGAPRSGLADRTTKLRREHCKTYLSRHLASGGELMTTPHLNGICLFLRPGIAGAAILSTRQVFTLPRLHLITG
jgi:hypothetical protein